MRPRSLLLAAAFLGACEQVPTQPTQASAALRAPESPRREQGTVATIPDRYIVVFMPDVRDVRGTAERLAGRHRGKIDGVYSAALKGMAVTLPPEAIAAIEADDDVDFVEADQAVSVESAQLNPTWGLDRIDQRLLPTDGSYTYMTDAAGVRVYIIDTGINLGHVDFGGRAITGTDIVTPGGSASDCHGHGTHVAGTAGGTTYGVAKKVTLVSVRVMRCDGTGSVSGIIAGVDWVTSHRVLPAVANMSLSTGISSSLNLAVQNSIAAGVVYAVSAGNKTLDACGYSPASAAGVITVGATTRTDAFAAFSNYGSCVALNAPGESILSAWYTSSTATQSSSGTSMATAHVSGAAALYLAAHPAAKPADVRWALRTDATAGTLSAVPAGTPNLLLYSLGTSVAPPSDPVDPPDPTPTVVTSSFAYSCSKFVCSFNGSASTNAASYTWTFSDGSTASGVTTSHAFVARSSNTVTLTVWAADNTSASSSKVVACNPTRCS